MTRRQTPASTLAAWQASRDLEQARKLAAAHALAEAATAHTAQTWTPCHPSAGIAAERDDGARVGWTNLDTVPRVNASVRVGDVFISVRGPDVPTALDALALAVARVTA